MLKKWYDILSLMKSANKKPKALTFVLINVQIVRLFRVKACSQLYSL